MRHFAKHGNEFQAQSAQHYEQLAEAFLAQPLSRHHKECYRVTGDQCRYNMVTEEYAVRSQSGVIRTYFKPIPCWTLPNGGPPPDCHPYPDNLKYFRASC